MTKRTRKSSQGFEEKLKRLEEISDLFENGEPRLEESIMLYKEAIGLYRELNSILNQAEKAIKQSDEGMDEKKPSPAEEPEQGF